MTELVNQLCFEKYRLSAAFEGGESQPHAHICIFDGQTSVVEVRLTSTQFDHAVALAGGAYDFLLAIVNADTHRVTEIDRP